MRIKEILQENGITQKELAEKLGMTQTGLSLAIKEDGNPPLKRLRQIASALGVSISELFADEAPDRMVAFIYYKGCSHTPTKMEEIMDILKDWREDEFHQLCRERSFEYIRRAHEGDMEVQRLISNLCALLKMDCNHSNEQYNNEQ